MSLVTVGSQQSCGKVVQQLLQHSEGPVGLYGARAHMSNMMYIHACEVFAKGYVCTLISDAF